MNTNEEKAKKITLSPVVIQILKWVVLLLQAVINNNETSVSMLMPPEDKVSKLYNERK